MSGAELMEWFAFAEIEPFGSRQEDFRFGLLASTVANASRSKQQRPFRPQDFMPTYGMRRPTDSKAMLHAVLLWNAVLGGKDMRK